MEDQNLPTTYKSEINIFEGCSTLKLTEDESKKISENFDENLVEIRTDGLIYLPQVFWRERLNSTFGIGQWALIPKSNHKDPDHKRDKLYLEGVLMVRGCYISTAIGEAELHSNNANQSWASVWESAKSDCITRCCKDLGIASELWQPSFIESWKDKYAVEVWCNKKDNLGQIKKVKQWRKKDANPFWNEQRHDKTEANVPAPQKKEISKPVNRPEGMKSTEESIDSLHNEYIAEYNDYMLTSDDENFSRFHPDNWKEEPTVKGYIAALKLLKQLNKENHERTLSGNA